MWGRESECVYTYIECVCGCVGGKYSECVYRCMCEAIILLIVADSIILKRVHPALSCVHVHTAVAIYNIICTCTCVQLLLWRAQF